MKRDKIFLEWDNLVDWLEVISSKKRCLVTRRPPGVWLSKVPSNLLTLVLDAALVHATLRAWAHLFFECTSPGGYFCYSHFAAMETEAQRGQPTCLESQHRPASGLAPRSCLSWRPSGPKASSLCSTCKFPERGEPRAVGPPQGCLGGGSHKPGCFQPHPTCSSYHTRAHTHRCSEQWNFQLGQGERNVHWGPQ